MDNVNHPAPRTDDEVLDLIHTVMHQYRSHQYQVLRDGPHEITHMESKVLGFIGRHPNATQSEMARHSGRDKAQLARLIKGLKNRGMIDAQPDADDRRNLRLSLTDDGHAVLKTLRQQAKKLNVQAVTGLNEKEQQHLLSLLQRVKANMDALD